MRIERRIVDKLGLKLYDKIAAAVAELIANSYDADAELVTISMPLGKALATKKDGKIEEKGYLIEVRDDGHGMTPEEANNFYLRVGKDRRIDPNQGDRSREKHRPVMGRKGIGKLAPYGVCRTIEVRSAGGEKGKKGFLVTHFELDYDIIVGETDEDNNVYHPTPLKDDRTWDMKRGTSVVLKHFLPKVAPDKDSIQRQLGYRFGLTLPDFWVKIIDNKKDENEGEFFIGKHDIPLMEGTKVIVNGFPVKTEDGKEYPVSGWVGMALKPYKNVEFAGIRIYVRGKIASITRDFGLPAGFTGEFATRSYLVGEIHADWLDDEEDLIQTHRQDVLWGSDLGAAFSRWGQEMIKKVAKLSWEPKRKLISDEFLNISDLQVRAKRQFNDFELEKTTLDLGKKIGSFASEDQLEDKDYVKDLADIILMFAPHKLLVDTFKRITEIADERGKVNLKELVRLFETSKIAQLASYGQIVSEKIRVIDTFETYIRDSQIDEKGLQIILEGSPWLIDSKWELLTANQTFKNFRNAFEAWYKKKYGKDIVTSAAGDKEKKRPDFIFIYAENAIKVIEIKPPKHVFDDNDWKRLNNYHDALTEFLEKKGEYAQKFSRGFQIILIADEVKFKDTTLKKAMHSLEKDGLLILRDWEALLHDTKMQHKDFLAARDGFMKLSAV